MVINKKYSRVFVLKSSPQLKVLLTIIRDKNTKRNDFIFYADRLIRLLVEESLNLLREYDISFVIASAGKRFPYLEATTNNQVYLRLHGDERLYSSLYSDEKLERYAFMINDWLLDGKEVWVFFNNTMFGSAIQNAKTLQELIQNM